MELVDHHHLELAGKLSLHARVVLERLVGEREQIVVIEHRPIMFERAIFGIDLCRERHEFIECVRAQGKVGFGEKCRARRTNRIDEAFLVFAHAARLLGELATCGVTSTERRQIARRCEIGVERLDGRARCGAVRIGRGIGNIAIGFIQINMRRMRLHLLERLKPTDERRQLRKDGNEDGEQARKAHRPILRLEFKCLEQLVEGPCAADIFRRHAPQHVLDGEALEIVCIARDRESGIDAKIERMGPDDARAHAMDGRNPRIINLLRLGIEAFLAKRRTDALLELGRRLVRERDGKHLVDAIEKGFGPIGICPLVARLGARFERIEHALGEREGLAGPGARRNEERPFERAHDALLLCL